MRFGVHMSIKSNFAKSLKRIKEIGGETIQIFPGNPTSWRPPSTPPDEIAKRVALMKELNIYPMVVHTAYLINLATAKEDFYLKSKKLLHETLVHAALYKAPYVVLHTGSHGGSGAHEGIKKIVAAIEEELKAWPEGVKLLLENTAGGGSYLGGKVKDVGTILDYFPGSPLGFCMDTAHAWAAGYDISGEEGVSKLLEEVDKEVGLDKLHVIHANDTSVDISSRHDRHQHIGEGLIGFSGFKALLQKEWPEDLPVILETPDNGTEKDSDNLKALRSCLTG